LIFPIKDILNITQEQHQC